MSEESGPVGSRDWLGVASGDVRLLENDSFTAAMAEYQELREFGCEQEPEGAGASSDAGEGGG